MKQFILEGESATLIDQFLEIVESFCYLGDTIGARGGWK